MLALVLAVSSLVLLPQPLFLQKKLYSLIFVRTYLVVWTWGHLNYYLGPDNPPLPIKPEEKWLALLLDEGNCTKWDDYYLEPNSKEKNCLENCLEIQFWYCDMCKLLTFAHFPSVGKLNTILKTIFRTIFFRLHVTQQCTNTTIPLNYILRFRWTI